MTRAVWTGSRRRRWNVQRTQPAASSNKRAQWRDLFSVALIAPRYLAGAHSEGLVRRAGARLRKRRNSLSSPTPHCRSCVRTEESIGCQGEGGGGRPGALRCHREMSKMSMASLSWFTIKNRNLVWWAGPPCVRHTMIFSSRLTQEVAVFL